MKQYLLVRATAFYHSIKTHLCSSKAQTDTSGNHLSWYLTKLPMLRYFTGPQFVYHWQLTKLGQHCHLLVKN